MGTQGYWAYTHIFTANGPSDVADLGVGLNNGGQGLFTAQANLSVGISEKLTADVFGGWFRAAADSAGGEQHMGEEFGAMLTCKVAKYMNVEIGAAYALLGDFYKVGSNDPENLYEIFGRGQIQF